MQHQESNTKIYYTKDYGRFVLKNGNRAINQQKVRKLIATITDGRDLLKFCPILVNETPKGLEIADGQHRFTAAQKMGSHVWYIVMQTMTLQDIAEMNCNTEKWKTADFINCWAKTGNEAYSLLGSFMEATNIPVSISVQLFLHGKAAAGGGGRNTEVFREGRLTAPHHSEAVAFAEKLRLFEVYPKHTSPPFIRAVAKVLEAGLVPIELVAEAVCANVDELEHTGDWKLYVTNMERLYNKGRHKRVVIW